MRILSVAGFDPNWAFAALVGGILLVYFELARPGTYWAGSLGGVLVLVSLARLSICSVRAGGLLLMLGAIVALLAEIRIRWPGPPGFAGALLLTLAATRLTGGAEPRIRWYVAAPLAYALAAASVVLGSAAWRGWVAKRSLS